MHLSTEGWGPKCLGPEKTERGQDTQRACESWGVGDLGFWKRRGLDRWGLRGQDTRFPRLCSWKEKGLDLSLSPESLRTWALGRVSQLVRSWEKGAGSVVSRVACVPAY